MRKFPDHHMAKDDGLVYLGTHYGYDIYILKPFDGLMCPGMMYAVHGPKDPDYACAVGYYITRTQRKEVANPLIGLACAVALLEHPEYVQSVRDAHK